MKLYIWKHKDTANTWYNFYPLSECKKVGKNAIYPIACHAFFKKKEAIKYLKEIGWDETTRGYFELLSIEL